MADEIQSLTVIANDSNLQNNVDTIDGDEHNAHRANYRTEINRHKTVLEQQESNYAGLTVTNEPKGKMVCNATTDPAQMEYYKDSSGNREVLAGVTLSQTLSNKNIAEYTWGTSAQVSAGTATMYVTTAGVPKDASAVTITFTDGDRIAIVHSTTLTEDLILDGGGAERLNIFMARGVTLDLGADSGNSNVPYKFRVKNADKSICDIHTNKDYNEVLSAKPTATRLEQSVISNQTQNSTIFLNGRQIFGRNRTESLPYDPKDPYDLVLNGETGVSQDEYKDLFNFIGFSATTSGQLSSALSSSEFTLPDFTGVFERYAHGNGENQTAGAHHSRTATTSFTVWPGTATSLTADLTSGSNEITLDATAAGTEADNIAWLEGLKGLRVTSANNYIPDSTTPQTSIIWGIDTTTSSAVVLTLVESEDKSDSNATSTASGEVITIDNSGDCIGSKEQDEIQGHWHETYTAFTDGSIAGGSSNLKWPASGFPWNTNVSDSNSRPISRELMTDSDNSYGSPRDGKETHPESATSFKVWRL